jgi:pimeloyl-ACP methyl ester carboxylesterase
MWPGFPSQERTTEYYCPWSKRNVTVGVLTCGEDDQPIGLTSCSVRNCETKCLTEAPPDCAVRADLDPAAGGLDRLNPSLAAAGGPLSSEGVEVRRGDEPVEAAARGHAVPCERDEGPANVPIWLEAFFGLEWFALRTSPIWWGYGVPSGRGDPVIVIPGFMGTDLYLRELYFFLARIGYRPYMSGIGRNADCLDLLMERLLSRIDEAHAATGRKVHLVGHSLGGMLARAAATHRPAPIASVVTLGSPFRGVRSHPLVLAATAQVRRRIQAERKQTARAGCFTTGCGCACTAALREPFSSSVPQIAVYTRTDGITDWRFCINDDPATNIEVLATHIGLVMNPVVYHVVANHLARTP